MIKWTLESGMYSDLYIETGYPCYVWRAQIDAPGHACDGFYLDQNAAISFVGGFHINHITKWKKNRNMWGLKFSNDPRSVEEINDWNVNNSIDRFYMDYWRASKFQIPRKYYPYNEDGGAIQWTEQDRSCHCLDGRCDAPPYNLVEVTP